MNYLGHYVYNHHVRRRAPEPYFVLGVALPDLWPRYSRRRRLRWRRVRQARPADATGRQLRAGLLNHVATDARFHALPCFNRWLGQLRGLLDHQTPGLLADFAAHLAIELALDHHLARTLPHCAEEFYDQLSRCESRQAQTQVGALAGVATPGLAREIDAFITRRFLPRFAAFDTLPTVAAFVCSLLTLPRPITDQQWRRVLGAAVELVEPREVWHGLTRRPAVGDGV